MSQLITACNMWHCVWKKIIAQTLGQYIGSYLNTCSGIELLGVK